MDRIGQNSQANDRENEDFLFTAQFGSVQLLVVGDFAQSEYARIDAATINELQQLSKDTSVIEAANNSIPLLLSQVATKLNGRLLGFAERFRAKFQAAAIFAAIRGTDLYYLPVGDCRLSICRGKFLVVLNGTVWVDSFGNSLPMLIESGQDVYKASEAPPDQALGISPNLDLSIDRVKHANLNQHDLVLLYSDGVDKFVSPVRLLELSREPAPGEPVQTLTDKIIDEVRINHGNDDRTLIIAAGPHIKEHDPALAESIQQLQTMAASVTDVSDRITSLEDNSKNINGQVTQLKATVDSISTKIDGLPTLAQLKSTAPGTDGVGTSPLSRLMEAILDIQTRVKSIEGSTPGNDNSQPEPANHQGKNHKRNSHKPAAAPNPVPAYIAEPPEQPPAAQLAEVKIERRLREGVLRVDTGFYELVDESAITEADPRQVADYFAPPVWAPPGWLTAIYLYLRLRRDQLAEDAPVDSLKTWIQKHQDEASTEVGKLSNEGLQSLRQQHWRLRNRRRSSFPFRLTRTRLKKKEKKLALEAFSHTELAEQVKREMTVVKPPTGKQENRDVKVFIVILAVIGIIVAAAVYMFWGDAPNPTAPRNETVTTAPEPVELEYGAEGRTLFAVARGKPPELLEYRITIGRELAFRRAVPQLRFNSRDELLKKILNDAADLVSKSSDVEGVDIVGNDLRVFQFEAADINAVPSAPSIDKCTRYLSRVNRSVPPRNTLEDLQKLNPGLRCQDLKVGDRLVVYARKPQ